MSPFFSSVVCLECGHAMNADVAIAHCERCGSHWVDARYDYDAVAGLWPASLHRRASSLWRYAELLPLTINPEITLGEGHSPLIRLYQYERIYDHPHIYIKDERQGPTSSFKDRQAAMAVMAMQEAGITECVLASTGNAGAAYAAYCARAGIKLWLFLTSLVTADKMREAALYGAEVIKVSGTYDETKRVAAEFARRKGIHFDGGAKAIPGKESMKTLAYEIAEQLGLAMNSDGFVSPDWYIQAVSGGIGPLGVWKGFSELLAMGLIDKMPRLGIIQAAGCAPMVEAFHAGHEHAAPVVPKTLITVLATGDPGFSYVQLREAVLSNNGAMLAIDDGETFAAMRRFAEVAGISVEPATAVAVAGLQRMLQEGIIAGGESVVMNCSGHTFPVESHILGDQYLLNLKLEHEPASAATSMKQNDGLSAALENLDEQITTILVVDDNLNDRRLIRRLLKHRRSYRVFEASNGADALEMVHDRKPDLIICDLTMPHMDGFTFVEKLKENKETEHIPIVVVSAKSLTAHDRQVLEQNTSSIWTKGGFSTHQLVDHVADMLGLTTTPAVNDTAPVALALPTSHAEEQRVSNALPTIVLIDSEPESLRLQQRYLKMPAQYHVVEASSGRDGLKAIYLHYPDLIVIDLLLYEMSGFEVIEALKANPALSDIPIVVVTSAEMSEGEILALSPQIRQVLPKATLNREEFSTTIDRILAYEHLIASEKGTPMPIKILYIEDNAQNLRLVRKMLGMQGHEMIQAETGTQGIEMAKNEKPDLILMDINLPDINGLKVTAQMKADSELAHIPIIALTANAMQGDRERFLSVGCDGYLAKPVSKKDLLAVVERFQSNSEKVSD